MPLQSLRAGIALFCIGMTAGCRTGDPAGRRAPDARAIFLADVRAKGIAVQQELPDNRFVLAMNGFTLTVALDSQIREFDRSHDPQIIHRYVRALDGNWPAELTWKRAKPDLLYIAEPAAIEAGDSIEAPVTLQVIKVLEHYDSKRGELRLIAPKDLKHWNVSQQQVDALAERNMTALISGKGLHLLNQGPVRYAWLDCPEAPSQASLFLSEGFKKAMKATLGLPVYVALPNRDTLYILPAANRSQIPLLRQAVLNIFQKGSHPITTEVLEVSSAGIRPFKDLAASP